MDARGKPFIPRRKKRDERGRKIYGDNWLYAKYSLRKISPLNSSGEIGVSYSENDLSCAATWQEGTGARRKQRNAYFSINKYREAKAKRLAIKTRRGL